MFPALVVDRHKEDTVMIDAILVPPKPKLRRFSLRIASSRALSSSTGKKLALSWIVTCLSICLLFTLYIYVEVFILSKRREQRALSTASNNHDSSPSTNSADATLTPQQLATINMNEDSRGDTARTTTSNLEEEEGDEKNNVAESKVDTEIGKVSFEYELGSATSETSKCDDVDEDP